MGAADPPGAGEVPADDGVTAGAGEELVAVAEADGDMTAEGVAVGAALAEAGAGLDGATAAVAGVDVIGAEVTGELTEPETAGPECRPGACRAEAAKATPPAADAASSPATRAATASGRACRR